MGTTGMDDMVEMRIPVPKNSIPMVGGRGPFCTIDMGGMFTIVKAREGLTTYEDPGWFEHPDGTVVAAATADELRADVVNIAREGGRRR